MEDARWAVRIVDAPVTDFEFVGVHIDARPAALPNVIIAPDQHPLLRFADDRLLYTLVAAQVLIVSRHVFQRTGEGRRERWQDGEVRRQE